MQHISDSERRRRIGQRHWLAMPAVNPVTVAATMVGLHTSDPTTPYLALRSRMADASLDTLDGELFEKKSLLRMVGMRRTIFVIPRSLIPLFDAACNVKNTESQRKRLIKQIEGQGIAKDGAAWVRGNRKRVLAELAERGPLPGRDLVASVPALSKKLSFGKGKAWAGGVAVGSRLLFVLASAGDVVRTRPLGSWVSGQYRWAVTTDWLGGGWDPVPKPDAQHMLARMWLDTYGPGTTTDLQWWSGWTKGETLAALKALEAEAVSLDGGEGWVLPGDTALTPATEPQAWFLPGLDPSVMGYKERDFFLGEHGAEVFDRNGNVGPTVWWDGRIVGGWGQPESGEVRFALLEKLPEVAITAIEAERGRLDVWMAGVRVRPRFPAPLDKRLSTD